MKLVDGTYLATATPVARPVPAEKVPVISCSIVALRDRREVGRLTEILTVRGVPRRAFGILPPVLRQDKVIEQLPAPAADLAVGGGGRYLILYLPRPGKLAVFDVNKAKIAQFIAVDDDVKFAAGLNKLVVVCPRQRLLRRYSLDTFEQESTATLPIRGEIMSATMGSASQGPLLIRWAAGARPHDPTTFTLFNLQTLQPLPWPVPLAGPFWSPYYAKQHVRASPDGTVFGVWDHRGNGLHVLAVGGDQAKSKAEQGMVEEAPARWHVVGDHVKSTYDNGSLGHIVPGPGGRMLYTGAGLFTMKDG